MQESLAIVIFTIYYYTDYAIYNFVERSNL